MSKTYNIPPTKEEIKKRGAVGWCRVGYDIYIARGMTKKAAWEGAFMHTCKHSEQIRRQMIKKKVIKVGGNLKKCHLNCECQQEGYCVIEAMYPESGIKPEDCTAKTDADLMDEDEWEEHISKMADEHKKEHVDIKIV